MMIEMIRRDKENDLKIVKRAVHPVIEMITPVKVGIVIAVTSDAETDMMIAREITGKSRNEELKTLKN